MPSTEEIAFGPTQKRERTKMKVHDLTVERTDQPCRLHACLRHAFRLARWIGFFPVQGLGQPYADGTRFKIKSFYCLYYLATLIGQMVMTIFSVLYFFENDVDLTTISNIVFYVTGFISAILLLKLSQQWPLLMTKATETEQSLTELKLNNKTVVQTTVIAYVVMTLALVEHILCTGFNIKVVMNCLQETGITNNVLEGYVIRRMPFDGVPWSVLRVHYSNLVKLVKEIDVQISWFILVSFFTDLFYICLQLFNSLHRNHGSFKYCNEEQTKEAISSPYYLLYYLYSCAFLVVRALMLSIFASNVHCAGLEPVYYVYDIPSSAYNIEVIGTIITYEIVLLQYSTTPQTHFNGTAVVENITA
ncbi:hypothetical protein PYW08_014287 [Mythimna loreyi]|uniref:Uncharacterized protein n=1 Tax=Mythimna loreyi TaxID=667449 RepID=A0ACC2R7L8_9NEOP|nr:hypothetical protein PYW08_014287 [Mythimna loreyi]